MEKLYYYIEFTDTDGTIRYSVADTLWQAKQKLMDRSCQAPVRYIQMEHTDIETIMELIWGEDWWEEVDIEHALEDTLDNICDSDTYNAFEEYIKDKYNKE